MQALLNSYSLVLFSGDRRLGALLLLVTMMDPWAGGSGLLAAVVANLLAWTMGFDREGIRGGLYGWNSMLVGLGLGSVYEPGPVYFTLLLLAALLVLLLCVGLTGMFARSQLPVLSLPFLLSLWIAILAAREFGNLGLSERSIYWMNELYAVGGKTLVSLYSSVENFGWPAFLRGYLHSLSAIFFQYNLIAGLLIAIGLLFSSRIAFSLSIVGFAVAYLYYRFAGVDPAALSQQYLGFNFILSAIAIGGFFTIPSLFSYLWVVVLVPLIALVILASHALVSVYQLPVYSLPFNLITIGFVYCLKLRQNAGGIQLVHVQHYAPEKNLYKYLTAAGRFESRMYYPLHLPFFGEWVVSQGQGGAHTHKGEWSEAYDFEMLDSELCTHAAPGTEKEQYYCFGKPVLAPADGMVEDVQASVEDNAVGEVNLVQNWGNSVVIKHAPGLYSQLSHLKRNSVKVRPGEHVRRGDLLALCGSSGRSPVPHLHFQLQSTPYLGSGTLRYPLAHYMVRHNARWQLRSFSYPREGQCVSNVAVNGLLADAFRLVPGEHLICEWKDEQGTAGVERWEVFADPYNNTYVYCRDASSYAYFVNDGTLFWFTDYEGDTTCGLFHFYLATYKVLLGYYPGLEIADRLPSNMLIGRSWLALQDVVAPFFRLVRTAYRLRYLSADQEYYTSHIALQSEVEVEMTGRKTQHTRIFLEIRRAAEQASPAIRCTVERPDGGTRELCVTAAGRP